MTTATIVRVDVTAEDIAKGIICMPRFCPVALAMARALGEHVDVGIDCYDKDGVWHKLPAVVIWFIYTFDNVRAVQPFSFEVEIEV